MSRVAVDELSRLDQAFAGNLLLATFSSDVRALLEPFAEIVELDLGETVHQRGHNVTSSVFPFGKTMVSLIVELRDGRTIEVASIGREGAVGGIISCGQVPAFARAKVQIGGPALRVPMNALEDAKRRSAFLGNLFCRYADYLLSQVMQSVACNAFHSIQERAAHWLLTAQDRAGDRIELTQESLAGLLGVPAHYNQRRRSQPAGRGIDRRPPRRSDRHRPGSAQVSRLRMLFGAGAPLRRRDRSRRKRRKQRVLTA